MEPIFARYRSILLRYVSEDSLNILEKLWTDKSRVYHNINHLEHVIKDIQANIVFKELQLIEKYTLLLAAFFHDAIYVPKNKDNEDKSIKFFKQSYIGEDKIMVNKVCELIEVTKYRKRPIRKLKRLFWDADNAGFKKGFDNLMRTDILIRKEYRNIPNFKEGRIKFLESNIGLFGAKADEDIQKLIEYYKLYVK